MAAPVFDATSLSAAVTTAPGGVLSVGWNHTMGAGANNGVLVAVADSNFNNSPFAPGSTTPTATFGGQALTYMGAVLMNNSPSLGFIAVWSGLALPTGSQAIATSISSPGNTISEAWGTAYSYAGVQGFGPLRGAFGVTNSPAVSVPASVGSLVWGMLANWYVDTFSAFTLTTRQGPMSNFPNLVAGDGAAASPTPVSATQAAVREWAAVGAEIQPIGYVPPPAPVGSTSAFFMAA